MDTAHLAVFTTVATGAAVLPDIDVQGSVLSGRGGSTAARAFGRASMLVAEGVSRVGAAVYQSTASKRDRNRSGGHRTITHTWIGCAVIGTACWLLAGLPGLAGWIATLTILFVMASFAVRGLLPTWVVRRGWVAGAVLAATGTVAAAVMVIPARWPMLGAAVGFGCLVHTLGDMLTHDGCPVLWPLPIGRRRWYQAGLLPRFARFKAGGRVERWLMVPLLAAGVVAAAVLV